MKSRGLERVVPREESLIPGQRRGSASANERDILETFPCREELEAKFHEIWGWIEEHMELSMTSEEAFRLFPSLVLYDIPDGTRSTLTVHPRVDVGMDAALFCVAFVHTMRSLGAPSCVLMTHTAYNRDRGKEGLERILRIIAKGSRPLRRYARRNSTNVHWVGLHEDYELMGHLRDNFPIINDAEFDSYFLIDYSEQKSEEPGSGISTEDLPEIDVCIRHTKLNLAGGGWIPGKMLRSSFLYSQNGSLFSNWSFEEFVALATFSLLSKILNSGEGLVKMYGDIDEVKRRHQLREVQLFNQKIAFRPNPSKLFVLGSGLGLHQFYY